VKIKIPIQFPNLELFIPVASNSFNLHYKKRETIKEIENL